MNNIEQRLEYLEEANDVLCMQNYVLITAIKGLVRALPLEAAQDAVESIQLAFEDALDGLNYEDNPYVDLLHDVAYAFFYEKECQSAGETGQYSFHNNPTAPNVNLC